MKKSCVTACPVEWPDGRGISGRMRVEWVAGSPWNRWSDAHGMGGQMTVESATLDLEKRIRSEYEGTKHSKKSYGLGNEVDGAGHELDSDGYGLR